MANSDQEYIASSEDEGGHYFNGKKTAGRESRAKSSKQRDPKQNAGGGYSWETIDRSWVDVQEDEEGSLTGVVAGLVQSGKRKR
jgi:hypothetical protein